MYLILCTKAFVANNSFKVPPVCILVILAHSSTESSNLKSRGKILFGNILIYSGRMPCPTEQVHYWKQRFAEAIDSLTQVLSMELNLN